MLYLAGLARGSYITSLSSKESFLPSIQSSTKQEVFIQKPKVVNFADNNYDVRFDIGSINVSVYGTQVVRPNQKASI